MNTPNLQLPDLEDPDDDTKLTFVGWCWVALFAVSVVIVAIVCT